MLQQILIRAKFVGAAQETLDLGKEDILVKRLGDKVVSTHIDGHDNIHGLIPWRKKHDRNLWNLANLLAPVVAIVERQANIHEDQVGVTFDKDPEDIHKILYCDHFIAPLFQ